MTRPIFSRTIMTAYCMRIPAGVKPIMSKTRETGETGGNRGSVVLMSQRRGPAPSS